MTARAWFIGGFLALALAAFAPFNDFYLHNSLLYGNFMPPVVVILAMGLGLVVNPLLGERRFRPSEISLILALTLIVGGVICTGLNRQFTAVMAAPAKLIPSDSSLAPLINDDGSLPLPHGLFVGVENARLPDPNDPQHRVAVDGFHLGLNGSTEQAPWGRWAAALLRWLPLLVALGAMAMGIAAVVRRQWQHNERIAYPIARILDHICEQPAAGTRVPPMLRNKAFWCGFTIVFVWLATDVFFRLGVLPMACPRSILLPDGIDDLFERTTYEGGNLATLKIFFSAIGISFLLASDLSFSVWSVHIGANILFAICVMQGVPIAYEHIAGAGMGAYLAEFIIIAWIGRKYYAQVLRCAFGMVGDLDRSTVWWARIMLAGLGGLWLFLVLIGAPWFASGAVALLTLVVMAVMARMVAEAGFPLMTVPVMVNDLIVSCFGLSLPAAAVIPLTLTWMVTDARENLVGFSVNAVALGNDGQHRPPGISPAGLWTISLIGAFVTAAVMLWLCYHHDGMNARDSWWRYTFLRPMHAIARADSGNPIGLMSEAWEWSLAVGAAILFALAFLRFKVAGWPLHPLGFILGVSKTGAVFWFSIMLGWGARVLVMRYGAVALYRTLVPAAVGMICGEAGCSAMTLLLQLIMQACGHPFTNAPIFMP